MWSTSMSAEICQAVHSYINELFSEGLLQNILGALRSFSVYNEFSRLENLQVLGDSKHRYDVFMMLKNISEGLAECVMLWSCQSALSLSEFKLVLDCLLDSTHQEPDTKNNNNQTQLSFQNNGQLTREGLHLLMSLLHCLQPFSSYTCTDQVSDLTDIDWIYPLYSDRSFAASIGRLLDDQKSLFENRTTGSDSDRLKLLALIRLAWALCLRRTSHIRAELRRRQTVDVSRSTPYSAVSGNDLATMNWTDFGIGGDEEDELQAALAIESGALEFARKQVLNTPEFEREPLWVYRIHSIITDLIVHMPVRVKEIRLRDEDLLRSTGFDPSTTEHGFANFLLLIAQLYNQPGSRLHGRLALEFWWPVGELANVPPVALGSSDMLSTSITNKSLGPKFNTYGGQSRNAELDNIRQAALIRFLRLAGDMVTTPCLFLPYLRMLHSLCCSRSAAGLCFSLLKANATNPGRGASLITWDHFFNSFRQYLNHMKQMVAQPESNNLRPQISNQLYPHLYFNDGVTPRPRGSVFQRSTAESMCGHRKGLSASDMGLTPSANVQPRSIQPEEQAGLQAVLRLVARICRMDPVARSTFISNPQWQLLPMCMGFLTCPVSLDIKADILYLLTEFCKSQQNIPVIWQHFTSSELLPFTIQRNPNQPQSINGLNTDMDEVEPRAEEYPLTNAFLTLMIVMLPKLINYPITMPSNLLKSSTESREVVGSLGASHNTMLQTNPFLSIASFITNTIFLRHTMRAYRNPLERWDIASSCLILFDGLINDFLNRLNTATAIITAMMNSNHEKFADHLHSLFTTPADAVPEGVGDGQQHSNTISSSVDWPSYLLNILFQIGREQQIQGRHIHSTTSSLSTSTTSLEALISQLHLPVGWPYSDPGYHLATQLLTDSSLFRMVTGLLEVGLHRHLEFPLPNGPPVGMTRATYAGLSLIRRLLASEDILVTFVRRIATNIQPLVGSAQTTLSTVSIPLPNLPSFGLTILPVCVSRLLMSTNLGSGRADLIPMLLKYCMLVDYLPDHASCAVRILGYLASSIKPHSDLLELLTSDETARNQLLDAFAYLIKWPINSDIISSHLIPIPMNNNLDNEGHFAFTDEWLYGDQDNNELCLYSVGTFSARLSSPAIIAARLDAGFPSQTNTWYFPSQSWERYASYMLNTYFSDCTDVRITHNRLINNDYYTTAFGDWIYQITANTSSIPISISFLQILLAVMDQPAPNLAHWLCGFRIDSCKAISRSNLQDAGIADQQRTCLHSMLDMIDSASHWLQAITTQPFEFSCTLQWNLALIWQIFYKFGLSSLTSEPLLRFLRGNHDLIAKHLQSDLYEPLLSSNFNGNTCEIFTDRQKAVVEALSLNRKNWILRLYAIEIRVCAMANQRSYVTRLLKLFLGDLLFNNSILSLNQSQEYPSVLVNFMHFLNASEKIISESNLHESKLFNSSVIHELLTKSSIDCPLLTSDSNASKTLSTMIHFKVFLMNLFMKLIISRNDLDSYTNEDLNKLTALTFDQVFDINVSASSTLEIFNASSLTSSITTLPTASALMKQISSLCEWIDTRNMHHLHLYAGKQAATEAWRQAVEISLGLLTNQVQYGSTVQRSISQSMMTSVSSYLHSELMSLLLNSGDVDVVGASSGNISQYKGQQLRPVPVLCLDVLGLLLSQICAIKEVPQTIRLLASGTCLTLCSFLNCQSSIVNSPSKSNTSETALVTNGLVKCAYNKHWSPLLISVMELLVKSIVKTKTSTQRMRANYYGSLCYVIRFCRNLGQSLKDDKIFSADFSSLTECFSVFNPSNSKNTSDSIGLTSSDINQLYSTLITDLIHGHAMIQLTAISLLELLISFDRCSQQLIAYLDKQGTIQHILDTTIDDLNVISKFLTSVSSELQDYPLVQNPSNYLSTELSSNSNNEDYTPSVMSSFLLYQSKMSILCRIGSYLVGAKLLANQGILNRLANCDIFLSSNLANCYSYGLDCLYICEDNHHQEQHGIHNYSSNPSSDSNYHQLMDLIWFRSATFQRYSTTLSSSSQYIGVKCDNSVYWDLIELIITGIIEPGHETDEDESAKISWASTLMPTLRLCKIVINTLGPTHMSANQQIVNFLYIHSSSFMCNEVQLSSSIVTFLSRQDWSYINHLNSTSNQHSMNSYWLIQWIASETNIVNLFSLIMPFCNSSLNMSCTDEYSNLQREVLQSKILRHTFELLINLITPNNLPLFNEDDDNDTHDNLNRNYKFQNNCLAIEYFFIETQYIQLVYSLLFVLTGYLSTPENRLRKFALDGINSDPISLTRSLFQFFNNSTINPEQENSTPYTKIHNTLSLIVSLLQWSLKCLRSKEKMCLTLFDVQFLNNHKKNLQNNISIEEKHCHHQQQQFGQSVVNLLNCESFNENVSINELKQASSIIFKCPVHLLNSVDRTVGKDNQNAEMQIIQRLTQIGISCLHVQLRGLIGIIEQSAFLLWKHLNHLINNPDVLIENSKVPLDQSLQSHRVRNLSTNYNVSPLNSVKRSSTKATPTKRGALMNAINQEQSDNLLQQNSVLLRKHCEHLIQGEIMKMLNHLIKAAYLKQNQRLFIQVMHNRLERIIQKQLNIKLTT
ncbi:Nuclear pore complex protein isoform 2 [Schistosoma japonicum]|nr:Nuclear pore complex protein isoform 2 [Schistosoma japonicum]